MNSNNTVVENLIELPHSKAIRITKEGKTNLDTLIRGPKKVPINLGLSYQSTQWNS